ncbi:uncharacterized protein LOC112531973 isoform X1 [Gallus gallus]|uniref:uncharacterized protein LOC112531973 isoform X1 n=1 Tax=Gallus gallus TaxID=9031 RepID=UPI001F00D30E|nr:uncharacterized protein LOC112531973 isoform X1 [Gallus gallus]
MILSLVSKCSSHLLPRPPPPALPSPPDLVYDTGWFYFYITFLHLVLGRNLVARGDRRFTAARLNGGGGKGAAPALRPGVESSLQERCGPVGVQHEEGHKNDRRNETPLLQGQAERAAAVPPGEEKAPGRAERNLSVSTGGCKKEGNRL